MEKESVAVGMRPWEAMHKRFAMDNLDGFIEAVKATINWICFHPQRQAFSWSPPIPSMPICLAVCCGASNALAPKRRMFQRRMLWFAMVQT